MTPGWLDSVVSPSEDLYMQSKVSVLVVALVLWTRMGSAQSLGDVARQEEARRKEVAHTGKVYTNDSLKSDAASDVAVTKPTSAQPAPADATKPTDSTKKADEAKKSDDPKGGEAAWQKRIQAERDALTRSQTFGDALQSRISALSTDFVNRDDPFQRNQVAADRQNALAELERVKKEIQEHTKAIADIQEEGRKAGVPAGWLR